ncbi:MAG: hypothetical protein JW876_08760 [Candidatus Krumholzibacteriota bacterium]|nr:hypothetical protein [Candidatus Krumholzibacteriota bacterium]
MDQLIGLLLFFLVINIAGRVLRAVGAGQKKTRGKSKAGTPAVRPLDLERELTRRIFGEEFAGEETDDGTEAARPYAGGDAGEDVAKEESAGWFEDEIEAPTAVEEFEAPAALPAELDEARFESGVAAAASSGNLFGVPGPRVIAGTTPTASPRRAGIDARRLLAERGGLRDAIILGTILGPCRARSRMRAPRRFSP